MNGCVIVENLRHDEIVNIKFVLQRKQGESGEFKICKAYFIMCSMKESQCDEEIFSSVSGYHILNNILRKARSA